MNKVLAGALALCLHANVQGADLIVNGDFEFPNVTTMGIDSRGATRGWTTFYGQNFSGICTVECNGGTLVPGWSVLWTDTLLSNAPVPGRLEIQNNTLVDRVNPGRLNAQINPLAYAKSGEQKAELDSHDRFYEDGTINPDSNVSIFQTFDVCPRNPYTLTYYWKSRTLLDNDNDVRVVANDTISRIHTLNDSWQKEEVQFVTDESGESGVAFVSIGEGSSRGMSVDNISLEGYLATDCPTIDMCIFDDDGSSDDGSSDDESYDDESYDDESYDDESYDLDILICDCIVEDSTEFTLLYNGNNNTFHTQDDVSIEPSENIFPVSAVVTVFGHEEEVLFSGEVRVGELFSFESTEELRIEVKDPVSAEILQTIEFETNCSNSLKQFDEFGSITFWKAT